jgi:hypothetical protein
LIATTYGVVTIEEIGVEGHVPELLVRNPLTTDVLLYDGEEVVGGHIVASAHEDAFDDAGGGGGDDSLHLHGREDL